MEKINTEDIDFRVVQFSSSYYQEGLLDRKVFGEIMFFAQNYTAHT
jgi:hypothetical protein